MEDDNKERDEEYYLQQEHYELFFKKQGYKKSRRIVELLKHKIMKFTTDYDNPDRLHLVSQLRDMTNPFHKVFNKDLI